MSPEIRKLDAWLTRLREEHPFVFNLMALGIACIFWGVVLAIMSLLS